MRWRSPRLPLLLLLALLFFASAPIGRVLGFRICAYNVQNFNSTKAANPRVLHTMTRIVARCDITLLQEVADPDGSATSALLAAVNRETDRYEGYHYRAVSSKSLGRSAGDMQQYVFLYRTETARVTAQHQHQSKLNFARPPFAVCFHSNKTAIKDFILVPLHAEPSRAVQEMDQLYDVFQEVSKKWDNTNVMFLGDFHASCAHMTRHDKKKIRLFTNLKFSWLIGDKVDTTVSDETSCAYDRIVVHGEAFLRAIKPFSAQVFNVAQQFKLSRSKVQDVSNHLPVEVMLKSPVVTLKSSALVPQAAPLLVLLGASVSVQSFLSAL